MAVKETSATQIKGTGKKKPLITRLLPAYFMPTSCEVIVGRGKKCTDHWGNKRLRRIVRTRMQEYSTANDKTHKTYIISQIFHAVRKGSSYGGFVKHDSDTGRWHRVEDPCARTTIAQAFRDELHDTYRSSKFAKQRRRWGNNPLTNSDIHHQGTSDAVPPATGKFTAAAASVKSMFYPSMLNSDVRHIFKQWHQPNSFVFVDSSRYSSDRNNSGIIKDASNVMQHDNELCQRQADSILPVAPFSADLSTSSEDRATFDTLLSLTYSWESQAEPLENPFEPTPLPELAYWNSCL